MKVGMMEAVKSDEIPSRQSAYNTGVLPSQAIRAMIDDGEIKATEIFGSIEPDQIQPASLDLRLGEFAYPVYTSFLPGRGVGVLQKMQELDKDFERFKIDLRNGAVLEKGRVYVVPLAEIIDLKSDVAAFANPKSSTGRLDILTRLIADEATRFDQVESGYKGQLYIEIAPRSFSVVVKTGTRLNQLRFRLARGMAPKPIATADWKALLDEGKIADSMDSGERVKLTDMPGMLPFSIDLQGARQPDRLVGWRAKKNSRRIDLERRDYDPYEFWEPIHANKQSSLTLVPDEFYILMTKEAIAVPPTYAAEMLPYDTRAGEFRVHYAGFFDPGFGWDATTNKAGSSRGVLEVRSHEVPFLLEHAQTVGWLRYERMSDRPADLYGQGIQSNYQGQNLKLAKQFRDR